MLNAYTKEKDGNNVPRDRTSDLNSALKQGEEHIQSALSHAEKSYEHRKEQLKTVAADVNKRLHENPWPIVAGVAAGCILLGFVMGFSRK